jgi:surfeit locus 1 family protein
MSRANPLRHPAWVLLAALALALLTARLGVWQLDRAAQKQALQAAIEAQSTAPELPAAALPATQEEADRVRFRRITLRGEWLAEHTVYLDNRQMNGRPGYFVLTPLKLPGGDAVLVQRGWLPRHAAERTRIAPYDTPRGEVVVEGRIAPWPSRLVSLGAEASGPIRQNLDFAAYAAQTQRVLRPLSITELPRAAVPGDGLLRDWPMPAVDVAKHYGYAAQWFALSALTAGLYVWFQLIRPRRRADAHRRD